MNKNSNTILFKLIVVILCISVLTGCSLERSITKGDNLSSDSDVSKEVSSDTELLDPVVGTPAYVVASYRTLYDSAVYSGIICPEVMEYSYESELPFGSYNLLPGNEVHNGDILLSGNTDDIDTRISDLMEEMETSEKVYTNKLTDLNQDLSVAQEAEYKTGTARNSILDFSPDENSDYYMGFARGMMPIEGKYKREVLERERIEEQISVLKEKRDIEIAHNENLLNILENERMTMVISSGTEGNVAAVGLYSDGDIIEQGTNVVAIAKPGTKQIRTEFIDQGTLETASDVYAVIDGQRVEINPVFLDQSEYKRLKSINGEVFSTFEIDSDTDFELGQYCVIVVIKDQRNDVLCVPSKALTKEGAIYYLDKYEDGETTRQEVKIGMRDGFFTEILSGVSAGDYIISDTGITAKGTKKTLEKGSVATPFSETGYIFYPGEEWIKNPVENGTCYVNEICVDTFERVEKDQVLLKLEVKGDDIEIARLNRQKQRENERLADLLDEKAHDYTGKPNYDRDRAIRDRQNTITDIDKKLVKLSKYNGIVELKAPCDGVVMYIMENLEVGDLVNYKTKLMQVSNFENCYIIVEDKDNKLSMGNFVTINYKDSSTASHSVEGQVVTANRMCLSRQLSIGYAMIQINEEDMNDILTSGSGQNKDTGWFRNRYTVETNVRNMDNVLLVPKSAVKEENGSNYVIVKDDKGYSYVSVIIGGGDVSNYWIAEGIAEGTEICLD